MSCYNGGLPSVISGLRSRFVLEKSKEEARDWVEDLVTKSVSLEPTASLYEPVPYARKSANIES